MVTLKERPSSRRVLVNGGDVVEEQGGIAVAHSNDSKFLGIAIEKRVSRRKRRGEKIRKKIIPVIAAVVVFDVEKKKGGLTSHSPKGRWRRTWRSRHIRPNKCCRGRHTDQ